jgi:hypothetical protein
MAHLKRSIIEVKSETYCLAYLLITAIAKITNDPTYKSYLDGWWISHVVSQLLEMTGIDLNNSVGIPELLRFQEHFHEYKIVVYEGINCDSIMFECQVESSKRLNLFYDVTHY